MKFVIASEKGGDQSFTQHTLARGFQPVAGMGLMGFGGMP